uniref:Uncharacterized protein n=1 Tax=Chlorella ohadii TaxID=2649997 RepID=A0AAD5H9V7_9CHLO
MLQEWWASGFRRDWNARSVDMDRTGWLVVVVLGTLTSVYKLWLHERKVDLALVCATQVLLAAAAAAACTYAPARRLYVKHREAIVSLASLHCAFVCRRVSTNGGTNVFLRHGGSPLRLLLLLFVGDFFPYGVLYHLSARLSFAWTRFALPLTVLLPLLKEQSICHRVVATPGIQAPLWGLHAVLQMVHDLATLTPASRSLGTRVSTSPLEQCLAINTWLVLVAGIALPLAALSTLEQQARRLWQQRQLQRQRQRRQQLEGTPDPRSIDSEYMEDEANQRAVATDRAGWAAVAFLVGLLCVFKLWLEEGKPALAAIGATHVLLALVLVAACTHPPARQLYVRHRELIGTLASLHCTLIARRIAVNGGTNVFVHHGSSPLRLVGLLLACSHYLWSAIYLLYLQVSYAWCCIALPLLALLPLLTERSICHRLVATPGTEAPLQDLHTGLNLVQ